MSVQNEDTNKVVKLNSVSRGFLNNGNFDMAIQFGNDALVLSQKLKYKNGEANTLELIGNVHGARNNFAEFRKYFFSALKIYELLKNEKKSASNIYNIGVSYGMEENYPEALKYYYNSLNRWERLDDKENIALCLTDIALMYYNQGNNDECLKHVSKALIIYDLIGDKDGLARTYNFMAVLYLNQGNYSEALKKDSAVLEIYKELGNDVETFYVFQNMGNIDEKKGDLANSKGNKELTQTLYKQAFVNYDKALNSALRGKDFIMIGEAYANLGNIHLKLENFIQARRDLMRSLQMTPTNKRNLKSVYSYLASVDSAQGNYKDAYTHYKMFILFRDSLTNEDNIRKSTQLRLQYEFDKKEAISKATQDKKNIEVKRVRNMQYYALGVVLLIAGFLFRNNRQKQKAKSKVEKAYSELKSAQSQLIQSEKMASLGELTAGIAHEIQNPLNFVNNFSEVNKELIDELQKELKAGKMDDAIVISNDIKLNEEKINHHGKRADAIVKGMLQHSRSSTGQKEPTDINALADEYLRLAYHGLRAKDKSFNASMKTDYDATIGTINIVSQDIGRVILNLITNAFYAVTEKKNASAHPYEPTVSVITKKMGNKVLISVKDNGNGISQGVLEKIFQPFFTTKPTGKGTGLGLSLSYDIIKAHGGELKVVTKHLEGLPAEASAQAGTEFIIELPQ